MRARRAGRWSAALAAGALVLFAAGPVAACQVPATATVACAADLQHWEATLTLTNTSPLAFTLTNASLDVTTWADGSRLTGLTAGTRLDSGSQLTGRATGIPLTTAGALLSYAGRYADGRDDSATFTLTRPTPRCDEPTPTTVPTTTVPTTTVPTTTAAPASTPAAGTTVPVSVLGSVVTSTPTTAPPAVLGESGTSSSVPTLARTGAESTTQLAVGAVLLLILGVGLVGLALLGTHGRPRHHNTR
jgi:hypothetical protein